MRTKKALFVVPLLLAAVVGGGAMAQSTESQEFKVKITLTKWCQIVSTTDVNFGSQTAVASTHSSQGEVVVKCSPNTSYNLGLSYGSPGDGTINDRVMKGPRPLTTTAISYQLNKPAGVPGAGSPWGRASGETISGAGLGDTDIPYDIDGEATLVGNEPPGDYVDTVLAILTY